ncbi:uncharacterized protein LOC122873360 [Siniperca chuatsi]|uniref:Chemokine interleukin-8-like domain-containing protein n=1 Tax=Siniperca chuatsi TaxID=119488 RepID=Q2KKQ4_SINCH|nr:uncharacterized protein LOC122873360 [Siniperca chuatsi]AAY79326.1 unknown protein [Siniperca chuatsi]
MKTLVTLVLLTLICFLCYSSAIPASPLLLNTDGCCENISQMRIPKGKVRQMVMTPRDCGRKAIVVTTVCDKKICIDFNWFWAKNLWTEFKKSTANSTPPSSPINLSECEKKF